MPRSAPPHPQVPNFVAKRWKACCEQSAEQGQQQGRKLATLRLVQAPDESGATRTQYQLQLDGGCKGGGGGGRWGAGGLCSSPDGAAAATTKL